ncbi:MAG: hypothetical protein OHK0048_10470 [Rhodoferax sp.]
MTSSSADRFTQFVPGFEFLQNLAKGASQAVPQLPNLAQWVAPTLSVEELDKRIAELKAVHFWLDQNARALGATIQALEVQKMTLATLKDLNFNLSDLANAFKLKAADTVVSGVQKVSQTASATAHSVASKTATTAHTVADLATQTEEAAKKAAALVKPAATAVTSGLIDPMGLWNALAHQFQNIAAGAMKEAVQAASAVTAAPTASASRRPSVPAASSSDEASQPTAKRRTRAQATPETAPEPKTRRVRAKPAAPTPSGRSPRAKR